METALESRRQESLRSQDSSIPLSYFSLYNLKVNRLKATAPGAGEAFATTTSAAAASVVQFLDKEATLNKDFSLSVVLSNVPSQNESYLRENMAKKIEKGTLYASNSGNITTFYLGFRADDSEIESICYFNLYRQKQTPNNEYLLCLVVQNSKYNLDLFRNEIDFYFENYVKEHLITNERELFASKQLESLLVDWFQNAVDYLQRSTLALQSNVAILIEEALTCGNLSLSNVSDEQTRRDCQMLFQSFDCSYLIATKSTSGSRISASDAAGDDKSFVDDKSDASILRIHFSAETKMYEFSKHDKSQFSDDCARILLSFVEQSAEPDAFQMKQALENCKLKLAQELNKFNRYLRKAENHYYDIYRLFLYLVYSPINETLINMYRNCLRGDDASSSLLQTFQVVVEFFNANKTTAAALRDDRLKKESVR